MMFNTSKCHMLHLGNGNKIGGQVLDAVESEKDVGVMVHQSLKPSLQCTTAAEKANLILGQLSRGITYRDKQTFLKLFKVYVRHIWSMQ
jgi:ABC-type transporter MlaC component